MYGRTLSISTAGMRTLLLAGIVATASCLGGNTISGSWVGCRDGDTVYVELSASTEGADEADYFACEASGFEFQSRRTSFELNFELQRDGRTVARRSLDLTDVMGDYYVGVIQF